MVTRANEFAGFYSLTNEHLGIIVQSLAEKQPPRRNSEKIPEISKTKSSITTEPRTKELIEENFFNLDISGGETAGRAVLLASEANAEVENFWVFRTARNDEDIERDNFQLLRKLPKASEAHLFVDECYQVILERPADSEGLANYVHMLTSKHLSPRDFIKVLLTSDEGRTYIETLIIVPYPSAQLKKRNPPGIHS
jgi:hypothetical protein